MTNEKMLEAIYRLDNLKKSESYEYDLELGNIVERLKNDIISDEAKKNGKAGRAAALKRFLKVSPDVKPELHGTWIVDGFQYACNGYAALKLTDHIPSVESPGFDGCVKLFNFDKGEYSECSIPSSADIKSCIAEHKAKTTGMKHKPLPVMSLGECELCVNPEYLQHILSIVPGCKMLTASKNGPIYFTSDHGEALLIPVHKAD